MASLLQHSHLLHDLCLELLAACLVQRLYSHGQDDSVRRRISLTIGSGTLFGEELGAPSNKCIPAHGTAVNTAFAVSALHLYTSSTLIHKVTLAILAHLTWPRLLYLIHMAPQAQVRRPRETKRLMRHFWSALASSLLAFFISNLKSGSSLERQNLHAFWEPSWAAVVMNSQVWCRTFTAVGVERCIALVRALCPWEEDAR